MVDRMKDHSGTRHDPNTDATAVVASHGFGQFYKCAKFSDVTLVDAIGNRTAAHRLVLSAGSKKFNEMLSRDAAVEIYCNDVEPECLHAMLQHLYTNRCDIQMHNAVQLLAVALLYGCDELESMASLYIHMELNGNTCCFFFAEAQKHKVEHIAIKSLYIASLDYQNAIRSQSFYELSLENVTAMLGSPKLGAISRNSLCKAAYAWMMKDPSRCVHCKDVFICIQTRPPTQSEEINLLRFLNAADGRGMISNEQGDDIEWTSTAATTTTASCVPFESKRSDGLPSDQQASPNAHPLSSLDLMPSRLFSKDSTKSDEKEVSTDASRRTNALCGSLFAHHLKKNETRPKSSGGESVKARSIEDNVSSETSSTRKPKTKRGRGRKGSGRPSQPYTCQVEGCTANLQGLKEYHIRYKICQHHLKVGSIMKDGQQQRFCQQCGRFHQLSEFDNNKRSCRARLQRHNLRRRKRLNGSAKAGAKQTGFLSMSSVGIPSQHLVYLPTVREVDAHSTNVEKLYSDGRSRCVQFLPPSDMNSCLMFSPVPHSNERDPSQQTLERAQSTNETNTTCATHRSCYVKPDPGSGRSVGKSGI